MAYGATVIATIASGATASDVQDLGGSRLVAIITPAALTGVALTFNVLEGGVGKGDSASVVALFTSAGTALSFTVAPSRYIAFSQDQLAYFKAVRYVQVVSGTAEGAARSIILVTSPHDG